MMITMDDILGLYLRSRPGAIMVGFVVDVTYARHKHKKVTLRWQLFAGTFFYDFGLKHLLQVPYPPKNKPPPLFDLQVLAQVLLPLL